MLVGKTALPMDIGNSTYKCPTPLHAAKGDLIGIHVDLRGSGHSCISNCRGNRCSAVQKRQALGNHVKDNRWPIGFKLDMSSRDVSIHAYSLKAYCA